MLAGNFSKDLASFSKIRFPFPKIPALLPKGLSYLATTRVFNNLFLSTSSFLSFLFQMALWYQNLQQSFYRFLLGIALSIHYELHTRKEGADRKGVTLRGFATFLGHFSDLMKLHELQMKNIHSTEYLWMSAIQCLVT